MNELVHRLKLQAGINDNPDQEGLDLFAQLIIRECAKVSENRFRRMIRTLGLDMTKHFGVEL